MNPPDTAACWAGEWTPVPPSDALWAQAALARTVAALPQLHAWRLGDDKGTRRTLMWCGAPADGPAHSVAVLAQTAPPPDLPLGDVGPDGEIDSDTLPVDLWSLATDVVEAVARPSRTRPPLPLPPTAGVRRWVGAMSKIAGAWFPPFAVLPSTTAGLDDPSTRWSTESLDFAERYRVHAEDRRFAADVLAPHVIALLLDVLPTDAALTMAGDAVHVWWEYSSHTSDAEGRVATTVDAAVAVREALPTFLVTEYPDRSAEVEATLAERAESARRYRAERAAGRHRDPTLDRIYAQARAAYEAEHPLG